MKTNFSNPYAQGIKKPRRQSQTAFFAISTITSGICLGGIAIQFIDPSATFSSSPLVWLACFVVGFTISYIADFYINQKIGRYAITEIIAWRSGYFQMPTMRIINAVIFSSILAFGVFVSFITSWDGSRITANMAPTIQPPSLHSVAQSERAQISKAAEPYRQQIKDIEGKIAASVKAQTSGELQKLAASGNAWAKSEITKIQAQAEKQYKGQLQQIQKQLSDVENRENARADLILKDTEKTNTVIVKKNEERTSIIWNILTALGTLPLIFGMLLVYADCNEVVWSQKPKNFIKKTGGQDPHQRSAEDEMMESLYMEGN